MINLNKGISTPIALTIIIVLAVILVSGIFAYQYYTTKEETKMPEIGITEETLEDKTSSYPQTSDFDFYSIHELKQNNFLSGNYNTEGYVVKRYECPACPAGALCKPCMGDNIIISENNKLFESYEALTDREIIIFVDNPKQFELDKKYKFSVKILDFKTTGEPINDIELIGYEKLKKGQEEKTADWKIYRKTFKYEEFGFEIKYPKNFKIMSEDFQKSDPSFIVSFIPEDEEYLPGVKLPNYFITIRRIHSQLSGTQPSMLELLLIEDVIYDGSGKHPDSINEFEKRTIGNNSFYFIKTGLFEGQLNLRYYLANQAGIFSFQVMSNDVDWTNLEFDIENDQGHLYLKKILSTFKFID